MSEDQENSRVLYRNSNKLAYKHMLIIIVCVFPIVLTAMLIIDYFSLVRRIEFEGETIILYILAFLSVIAAEQIIKNTIKFVRYRNIEITDYGIREYWFLPSVCGKFTPFAEIAVCYKSELDFETFSKKEDDVMVPIVLDAGSSSSFSHIHPDGNDLVIFTKNYEAINLYNLHDANSAFSIITQHIDRKHKFNKASVKKIKVLNKIESKSKSSEDTENEKIFAEVIYKGVRTAQGVIITALILLAVIFFAHLENDNMLPVAFSFAFAAFIFIYSKSSKLQITAQGIKYYENKNELVYSCPAENIEQCQIVKKYERNYHNEKLIKYYLEILNNDTKEIVSIKIAKSKAESILNGINLMMLHKDKIL